MPLCDLIHDDRLGAVDFCCVSLVSHYISDIPCKNYNYKFVCVKVIPKTLLVPFFSGHGVLIIFGTQKSLQRSRK